MNRFHPSLGRVCLVAAFATLSACSSSSPSPSTDRFCQPGGADCPGLDKLTGKVATAQLPPAGSGVDYSGGTIAVADSAQYSDAKVQTVLAGAAGGGLAYDSAGAKLSLDATTCSTGEVLKFDGAAWTCAGSVSEAQLPASLSNRSLIDPTITAAGSTVSPAELSYLTGVTGGIQAQLDARQVAVTGAASTVTSADLGPGLALISDANGKIGAATVSATELGYLAGTTGAVQTQLDGKQPTLTGAATTIATSDLPASAVLVSDASGKVTASSTTATELGYLSGVTSPLQSQLDTAKGTALDYRNRREVSILSNPASTTFTTVGLAAPPTILTEGWQLQSSDTSDGPFVKLITQTGHASMTSPSFKETRFEWAPEMSAYVRGEGFVFGGRRVNWVALTGSALEPNAPASGQSVIGFRWDTALDTDGHWNCVASDGSGSTVVDSGQPSSDSIAQVLRIKVHPDLSAVDYFINDALVCTISTHLPASTTYLGYQLESINTNGGGFFTIAISRVVITSK